MNCKDATALMSQAMDRDMGAQERMGLRVHKLMCAGCRNYNAQIKVLREAARRMAHGLTPPPLDEGSPDKG